MSTKLPIYFPELFDTVSKTKGRIAQVKLLRDFANASKANHDALKAIVEVLYHPSVKWMLPDGLPGYNENKALDYDLAELDFAKITSKLFHYLDCPALVQNVPKREKLFVNLLEGLYKEDAELLIMMKKRKLKYKGVTEKLFREAFTMWLPPETKK